MTLNRKGFSIAQVMIAAGMLSLVAVGVMKVMQMQSNVTKKSSQDMTIRSIVMEMNSYLADATACENSLKGVRPDSDEEITIKNRSGVERYTSGQKVGREIEIKSLTLHQQQGASVDERGVFEVKAVLNRLGKHQRTLTKNLKVMATLAADGTVESCESYETTAIETGIQRSCESIGGIFDEEEGECHFEDELAQKLAENPDFVNAIASNPAFAARFASTIIAAGNQAAIEATRDSADAAAASNAAAIEATNTLTDKLSRAMQLLESDTEATVEDLQANQKEALTMISDAVVAVEQNRLTSEQNTNAITQLQTELESEIQKLDELKGNIYKIQKAQENVEIARQNVSVAQAAVNKYASKVSSSSGFTKIIAKIRLAQAKITLAKAESALSNAQSYLSSLMK